jgi:AcrR family transcriptional regulator
MAPRTYQLGKRQTQISESRQRVIVAARSLLGDESGYSAFTIDTVAALADVARATVYYQFTSKVGLLEAVCDSLGDDGKMSELSSAFIDPDPLQAIEIFVDRFGQLWNVDRAVMRRLRALATLDPEVGAVIDARDRRRRTGLEVLVARLSAVGRLTADRDVAVRVLFSLTSFETFDSLAGPDRELTDVGSIVFGLATQLWT